MSNSRFVIAYDRESGLKHRIPAHWLDNPILSKPWRKTPKQRAADRTADQNQSATPATDVVAVSGAPSDLDSTTPPTTETPAAGAKE